MDKEMQGIFERIRELIEDLGKEYQACAQKEKEEVSERAKNLFHEVLIKIRVPLDFTMRRIFKSHTTLEGTDKASNEWHSNFPICETMVKFEKKLKNIGLDHLQQARPDLYAMLQRSQPFQKNKGDLKWMQELSNLGKHAGLAFQSCQTHKATKSIMPHGPTVTLTEGGMFQNRDGKPIIPLSSRDIEWTTFSVSHSSGDITFPCIWCQSLYLGCYRYIEKLLALI